MDTADYFDFSKRVILPAQLFEQEDRQVADCVGYPTYFALPGPAEEVPSSLPFLRASSISLACSSNSFISICNPSLRIRTRRIIIAALGSTMKPEVSPERNSPLRFLTFARPGISPFIQVTAPLSMI